MAKYRLKAPTVDAVQWRPGIDHPDVRQVTVSVPVFDEFDEPFETRYVVRINNSDVQIYPGDWIITHEAGAGVCRDGYFQQNYEPA